MTTPAPQPDLPDQANEVAALRAALAAEQAKNEALTHRLSAWVTAATRWQNDRDAHRRRQFLELLDDTRLQHSAQIVEDVIRDRAAARAAAEEQRLTVASLRAELRDLQLAVGDQANPELLAVLRQYRILYAAADDALWILGFMQGRTGRTLAVERLRESLGVEVDLVDGAIDPSPADVARLTRRNALEAVTQAASNLRAVIAGYDMDQGVTWMYEPLGVYDRIKALDLALDMRDRLDGTPHTEAGVLLENVLMAIVKRLVADLRLGDRAAAEAQLTALIGEPLGGIIVRELAQRDANHST